MVKTQPANRKLLFLLASIVSGLLLFAAWPGSPLTLLVFIAWVPLLWVESYVQRTRRFFGYVYITMFIFNISTTWWIVNASLPGALAAFFANSLLMCLPWLGYKWVKNRMGTEWGWLALISFWMSFEYFHLQDWGLSWPWLTLGNVFASRPEWIQWYEYTGTAGGSLWVLMLNYLFWLGFLAIRNRYKKTAIQIMVVCLLGIYLPVFISQNSKSNWKEQTHSEIVVVQPNIDPYEKISDGNFNTQLNTLLRLSDSLVTDTTSLLVWPETALYTPGGLDEAALHSDSLLNPLWNFLKAHPRLTLFSGLESYRLFDQKVSSSSRPISGTTMYYEAYNSSVLINSEGPISFYHKSMLVPGVETLPWFLRFLDSWFEKFGGTTAGYARQEERTVLQDPKYQYRLAPAICYESVYGDFMARYSRNGANMIVIVTNDGWWGNTPGYRQHMHYACLRAIENRKWVVRSANTGISCFIDARGNIIDSLPWDKAAAIRNTVPSIPTQTFYTRFGSILSLIALASTGILILILVFLTSTKKRRSDGKGNRLPEQES